MANDNLRDDIGPSNVSPLPSCGFNDSGGSHTPPHPEFSVSANNPFLNTIARPATPVIPSPHEDLSRLRNPTGEGSRDNPWGEDLDSSTHRPVSQRPDPSPTPRWAHNLINPTGSHYHHQRPHTAEPSAQSENMSQEGASTVANQGMSTLRAWTMIPKVEAVYCGFRYTWYMMRLPLQQRELQAYLSSVRQTDFRSVVDQLDTLTLQEREFLNAFIDGDEIITLLAVIVDNVLPADRFFSNVPNRYIRVVTNVEPMLGAAPGPPISSKPLLDLHRPTYIKVHRKHMSLKVLDMYELPWELDSVSLPCCDGICIVCCKKTRMLEQRPKSQSERISVFMGSHDTRLVAVFN